MSDYTTKQDVYEIVNRTLDRRLDGAVDKAVNKALDRRLDNAVDRAVNKALDKVIDDFAEINAQFAQSIDARFVAVETRVDTAEYGRAHLSSALDTFMKHLDDIQADNAVRDAQFAQFEASITRLEGYLSGR